MRSATLSHSSLELTSSAMNDGPQPFHNLPLLIWFWYRCQTVRLDHKRHKGVNILPKAVMLQCLSCSQTQNLLILTCTLHQTYIYK